MDLPLKRYWDLLAKYLQPLRFKVALLALLIFSMIGLQLANPQIIRYFIDTALAGAGPDDRGLWLAALAYLLAALLLQGVGVAATYVGEDVGWRATNHLRADLARHCLHLDMAFHNEHTPGEMIERVDGDVADIAIFFAEFVIRIVGNVLLLIGVLLVLLGEDWRVSLALAVYTVLALVILTRLRKIAVPHWEASRQASADLFGFLEEHLAGAEDIRSSGAVAFVMRNLFRLNRVRLAKELKGRTLGFAVGGLWIALYTLGQGVALVAGYLLFRQGLFTLGTVYLVVNYTDVIFRPLREITREIENLQKAAAGITRVDSLLAQQSKLPVQGQAALPAGPLAVTFDNVTFSYAGAEPVLRQVNFHLAPGKVLGLLGRTGSGKTTLTRLLFRLYDPTGGSIHLGMDGHPGNGAAKSYEHDLRNVTISDLRNRVGMVTQDVQLFRASVRDNLTFFDSAITDGEILRVIDELELGDWLKSLPEGLDTELKSEGNSLSAGEAQLLAFTRVFLRRPGLVILDEASSRLDPLTEQRIERAVERLLAQRTGIIVAHHLRTVERADYIMILENGRILEVGERLHLANDPTSRFYRLLQTGMEEVLA
jgi:ABC-type multidrug transport system fused ATPase/permease subunit